MESERWLVVGGTVDRIQSDNDYRWCGLQHGGDKRNRRRRRRRRRWHRYEPHNRHCRRRRSSPTGPAPGLSDLAVRSLDAEEEGRGGRRWKAAEAHRVLPGGEGGSTGAPVPGSEPLLSYERFLRLSEMCRSAIRVLRGRKMQLCTTLRSPEHGYFQVLTLSTHVFTLRCKSIFIYAN